MSKQNTRATIDANIKQNGQQLITGQILNSVLNTMVTDYAEQAETTEKLTDLERKVGGLKNNTDAASIIFKESELVKNAQFLNCEFNKALGRNSVEDAEGYFVTPMLPIDNTKQISWQSSVAGNTWNVLEYDADGVRVDYWGMQNNRTITPSSRTSFIRVTGKIGTSLEVKNGETILWHAGIEGIRETPTNMLEDKDVFGRLGGMTIKSDAHYLKGSALSGFQRLQGAIIVDGTITKDSAYNKRVGYWAIEKDKLYVINRIGSAVYDDAYVGISKRIPAIGDALLCYFDGQLTEEICVVSPCDGYLCYSYDSNIDADIQIYNVLLSETSSDRILDGVNTFDNKVLHYSHQQIEDVSGYGITEYIPIPNGADVSWKFSTAMPNDYSAFFYDGNRVFKDKYHLQTQRTISASEISTGGFKYVIVTVPTNDDNAEIKIGGKIVYPKTLNARVKDGAVGVRQLDDEVKSLIHAGSDIDSLNGGINSILRNYNHPSGRFVLAHISDIHADGTRLKRFSDWCKSKSTFLDSAIHTGDAVLSTYDDGFDFWDNAGAQGVLNVVGNHDVAGFASPSYDWKKYINIPAYNRYIKPYVSQWGILQPSGAEAGGLCYYAKDYTAKGIRLIVLDDNAYDATQNTWLISQLSSAKSANLSVVIAVHAVPATPKVFDCPFTSFLPDWGASSWMNDALTAVDNFIGNGGDFVCWIGGHDHSDQVGVINTHQNQLFVLVNTGAMSRGTQDGYRAAGTKSEDCFNLLAVDRTKKLISITRVGFSLDQWGREKNTMLLNYSTHSLVICQ